MSPLGMTLFPLNVQEYKYYINMNINIKRGTVMINFSILFCILEFTVSFIFDFSITTLSFIHLSEQNFSSFPTPLASYFHCPIFPIADQYHVRLHTVATYILSELATKRTCEGTGLAKQQHLSPPHHHQKAFYQFLSCFLYRRRESTMIKTTTFMFSQRTHFHCLNSYHSRI